MGKPLVSIITPCYNGAKYLPAFLESVLKQSYRPIELLFVDDGSTDNTKDVFESYRTRFEESNIETIYIYQKNAGQAAAINNALPRFKGEYMMWVDSDDILLPKNITKKVNYLESNVDKAFVLCQGLIVNSNALDVHIGRLARIETEPYDHIRLFEDLIMERNVVFGPATIMVRSRAIKAAIPTLHIYESRQGQNWQLMLPLAYMFEYGLIDEPLFKYVVHNDSHSHQKRSYEQQMQRFEQFEQLIISTIYNIPQIQEIEKWNKRVHNKYLIEKFQAACSYRNSNDINKYYQQIKEENLVDKKIKITYIKAKNRVVDFIFKATYLPIRIVKNFIRLKRKW